MRCVVSACVSIKKSGAEEAVVMVLVACRCGVVWEASCAMREVAISRRAAAGSFMESECSKGQPAARRAHPIRRRGVSNGTHQEGPHTPAAFGHAKQTNTRARGTRPLEEDRRPDGS